MEGGGGRSCRMTPRAWLVDLDGTLYHALPVKLAMALELALFGWAVAAPLRRFRHVHEELRADPAAPAGDPFALQLERTAARAGLDARELDAIVREWMVERPGQVAAPGPARRAARGARALPRVRAAGAGSSPTTPRARSCAALGAADLFDVVVAAGEPEGPPRLKPAPDGLLGAARALGVAPAECLVIGDRDDADGEAARRAGMPFRRV